jgi:aspartyl-tRNA(Asn)/glutamyl-tRNA(Gln) amidotransferase subunit A
MKVGLPREFFSHDVDPEVGRLVDRAVHALTEAGAVAVEVSLPHSEYAVPTYYLVAPAEASSNLARYDGVRFGTRVEEPGDSLLQMYCRTRGKGFGREVKRRIMLGTFALRSGYYDAYYAKAQKARALIKQDFDAAFEKVEVIASPTAPAPAFKIGEKADPLSMYLSDIFTISCNLAGLPGISVPCGLTSGGLPVGLQLLGRPLDELTLFRVAAASEERNGMAGRRPPEVGRG